MAPRAKGIRNPDRPNGKAWKQGKSPAIRDAEAKAKAEAKAAGRAAKKKA